MDHREITGIRRHHNVQTNRVPELQDLEYARPQHDIRPTGSLHLQTVRRVSLHEIRGVLPRYLQQQQQRGHNIELLFLSKGETS